MRNEEQEEYSVKNEEKILESGDRIQPSAFRP